MVTAQGIELQCHASEKGMKPSLREILAESRVSIVGIAVLLLSFLDLGFRALWGPLWRLVTFLFTAVAILDIPYIPHNLGLVDRTMLFSASLNAAQAMLYLVAAFVLSYWVHGAGPFHSLARWHIPLKKESHA